MTDEYSREELEDLKLAYDLLAGAMEWKAGKAPTIKMPATRYLKEDEEIAARRALVRLLCSPKPLDSMLRRLLAALIAPDGDEQPSIGNFCPVDRKLVFNNPGRRTRQDAKHLYIAKKLFEYQRKYVGSLEDARPAIAKRLKVSEETVRDAWQRWGGELKRFQEIAQGR